MSKEDAENMILMLPHNYDFNQKKGESYEN